MIGRQNSLYVGRFEAHVNFVDVVEVTGFAFFPINTSQYLIGKMVKLSHHEDSKVNQLGSELLVAGAIGAAKGVLLGFTSSLFLRLISPTYRNARTQVKVFYYAVWISGSAVWWAEKQLLDFESRVIVDEEAKRVRILDEAADRGIYLEDSSP